MPAPTAPKRPKTILQHGETRIDNYAWLRDDNWREFVKGSLDFADPEVKTYLEQEARYTEEQMASTAGLQQQLYKEILGRIREDDETFPFPREEYFYYQRTEAGKDYPILCRKHKSISAPEEIYFDVNKEASGKKLFILGRTSPSPNNQLLAYGFNLTGSMERTIQVRDLKTGQDFPWALEDTTGDFFWVDRETLMYVERGPESRGQKVYQLNVNKGLSSRELIYDKPADLNNMFMGIGHTTDREYHLVEMASGGTSLVYVKKKSERQFKEFARGDDDISYSLEHRDGEFYILTNEGEHHNYMVYKTPVSKPDRKHWQEFLKERPNIYLKGFEIYGRKMVLVRKNNELAIPEISIVDLDTRSELVVKNEDEAYTLSLLGAYDPNSKTVRAALESPKHPNQDLEIDLNTGVVQVLHTKQVPNYDPNQYELKRLFATAHDGVKIPLTVLFKKGIKKDGKAPAFVYGYGSYGMGMPAFFSPAVFSLVDRGFVHVVAHIRGGDEKGYEWYLDGKLKKKMNTFRDFISACEFLIDEKFTTKGQIAINGGSAGGLLMGAVTNMAPDFFKAVVADVAFVDVMNTISDASLPLTPPEWEEWGNPIENKEDYKYMMQYSPYDNVERKAYPSMLYNSGISDEQVTYWEPAKMVAKLRDYKTDSNLLLLHIKMHAGHAGASKRYEAIQDKAFNYAFVLKSFEN